LTVLDAFISGPTLFRRAGGRGILTGNAVLCYAVPIPVLGAEDWPAFEFRSWVSGKGITTVVLSREA